MDKLRLVFAKGEGTRYIGHLDILRTFVRALRRAGVPVKYSEGFNPHAVMAFALPLGVGVTSECEVVDIAMGEYMPVEDVIKRVNANLPPDGLQILSGEYTDKPYPEIEKAEYYITIKTKSPMDMKSVENALASDEILVEKKTKKKIVEINIMEHIFESEILDFADDLVTIRVVVSAGNKYNIKPQLVAEALQKSAGLDVLYCLPHRKRFISIK